MMGQETSQLLQTCQICRDGITVKEIVYCPHCDSTFHRKHLGAWLLTHDTCAYCRKQLPEVYMKELEPRTQEEKEELQLLNDDYSRFYPKAGKTQTWNIDRYPIYLTTSIVMSGLFLVIILFIDVIQDNSFVVSLLSWLLTFLFFLLLPMYTISTLLFLNNLLSGDEMGGLLRQVSYTVLALIIPLSLFSYIIEFYVLTPIIAIIMVLILSIYIMKHPHLDDKLLWMALVALSIIIPLTSIYFGNAFA